MTMNSMLHVARSLSHVEALIQAQQGWNAHTSKMRILCMAVK
jgi:hypothetical protein